MEVCRAQFSSKRQQDGMQGVLALVQSSPGFTRILEKELGMDAAEMARIIRCAGSITFPCKVLANES